MSDIEDNVITINPGTGETENFQSEMSEKVSLKDPVIKQDNVQEVIIKDNGESLITILDEDVEETIVPDEILDDLAPINEAPSNTIEDDARAQHWVPKDEFKGDPSTWVDAKTFVERGSFFRKIESLNDKVKASDRRLATIIATLSQAEERKFKDAQDFLQGQITEAESVGDLKTFASATRQAKELELAYAEHVKTLPQVEAPQNDLQHQVETLKSTPEFQRFAAINTWVNKTDPLSNAKKAFSSELTTLYEQENPNASLYEKLNNVTMRVQEAFPDEASKIKSSPPAKAVVASPSSGARLSEGNLTYGQALSGLNSAQREVVEYLKRTGQDYKSYLKVAYKGQRK